MFNILVSIVKIVLGFVMLIKGADFFVDGAAAVAKKLGVPELVIGLTIVAMGTSAPEAAVSLSAAIAGNNGISIGNVIGSNIMNIWVILGITSVIITLKVKPATVKVDIPFMIICTIVMITWGIVGGRLTRLTGIVFLLALFSYMGYLIWYSKHTDSSDEGENVKDIKLWLIPIFIIGGLFVIVLGSKIAVAGAADIARLFGVSDRVIGLTIVALGTSLPELMTSVTAARKGSADIAIGNIVGSNLFNILFILGLTTLIIPLPYLGEGANFLIDGFVALAASLSLLIFVAKKKQLGRLGGIIMLLCYAAYFVYLLF
ncbi:cation:H+ antiporter [Lachnospiraceae bacterium NE2001]|nr:cation:H+ antiporter [Lachnospiraceae bacterium NE2001]